MFLNNRLIAKEDALVGREESVKISGIHFVNGNSIIPPFASELEYGYFGMGCFWGAERLFWKLDGVVATAVGYQGGHTKNPTYYEVCSGETAHTESVFVLYDPKKITYYELLKVFWDNHDSTQGMRQGNDRGTQYRSAIFCSNEKQLKLAIDHKSASTEVDLNTEFYYAEENHQQYLAKHPEGYCTIGGMGFCLPEKKEE